MVGTWGGFFATFWDGYEFKLRVFFTVESDVKLRGVAFATGWLLGLLYAVS